MVLEEVPINAYYQSAAILVPESSTHGGNVDAGLYACFGEEVAHAVERELRISVLSMRVVTLQGPIWARGNDRSPCLEFS